MSSGLEERDELWVRGKRWVVGQKKKVMGGGLEERDEWEVRGKR